MSFINVNGVWRKSSPMVNVNGVWRKSEEWVNVNGVWRKSSSTKALCAEDIIGFEMVYTRIKDIQYPLFPNLRNNYKLPSQAYISTETPYDSFDTKEKSIIFEYANEPPTTEGLHVYQGVLNVVLTDNTLIPISSIYDRPGEIDPGNLEVYVYGYTLCEPYGPPPLGWNRFFNTEDNIVTEWNADKKMIFLNPYTILPTHYRSKSYGFVSLIGIARNMTDPYHNMVGSKGILDHTIEKITLNGTAMPFKFTIYQ